VSAWSSCPGLHRCTSAGGLSWGRRPATLHAADLLGGMPAVGTMSGACSTWRDRTAALPGAASGNCGKFDPDRARNRSRPRTAAAQVQHTHTVGRASRWREGTALSAACQLGCGGQLSRAPAPGWLTCCPALPCPALPCPACCAEKNTDRDDSCESHAPADWVPHAAAGVGQAGCMPCVGI